LDRASLRRKDPNLLPALLKDPATRVIEFIAGRAEVVVTDRDVDLVLRAPEDLDRDRLAVFLGCDGDDTAYVGVVGDRADLPDVSDLPAHPTHPSATGSPLPSERPNPSDTLVTPRWRTLRDVGAVLSDRDAGLFATMAGLANWHASHTHCPRCGTTTEPGQSGWIRSCSNDGSEHYPRTDPAVIMAVTDADDRLLLARSAQWPEGRLSVLAGFVEPGESLEAAVAREVFEEVGVVVQDVRYLGNQPWPFPSSLMLGFTSRAIDPTLTLDMDEIVEAVWVSRVELRQMVLDGRFGISPTISIARRIIENWYGGPIDQDFEWTPPPP